MGSWSLYIIGICHITVKMWDYYGYGEWDNRPIEPNALYTFLGNSVDWYINSTTMCLTILISFIISICAIILIIQKRMHMPINISYRILTIWLIINSINLLL